MIENVVAELQKELGKKLARLEYFKTKEHPADFSAPMKTELLTEMLVFYKESGIDISSFICDINANIQERRGSVDNIIKSTIELTSKDIRNEIDSYNNLCTYTEMWGLDQEDGLKEEDSE